MELTTKVDISGCKISLSHKDRILMLGSCFTDNIGSRLAGGGFDVTVNPYGTLYNPESIINALTGPTAEFMEWAQHPCEPLATDTFDTVVITFGTAWVYRLKSTGHVVANCKKQDGRLFDRQRLTVDAIVTKYVDFIEHFAIPRGQQLLFTVSPIRHKQDGLHANQLSKATLLLAIDRLCQLHPDCCHYFPSYEIMMDELRDYRFYADDMLHPSSLAIDYIWQQLRRACFTTATDRLTDEFEALNRIMAHRPSDPDNPDYIKLVNNTREKIKQLKYAIQN